MKKINKLLSVAFAAAICTSSLPISSSAFTHNYSQKQFKSGDYSYYLNSDDNAVITKYSGNKTSVTVPKTIGGKKVVEIKNAFGDNKKLVSVTLPDSVQAVTDGAFNGCTQLKNISFTAKLKTIGNHAFYECTQLKSITLKSGVEEIGKYAFYRSGLTSVTIPKTVKKISKQAFSYCQNLAEFKINTNSALIGENILSDTKWYNSKSKGAVYIGKYFYKYKGSASSALKIKKGTTQICAKAVQNQQNITSVSFPSELKIIGNYSFANCSALKKISFPKNLKTVGSYAFKGCSGLTKITFPTGLSKMGNGVLSECTGITEFTLPQKITKVGKEALMWCKSLKKVSLNSSVTSIGEAAFNGCSKLTDIKLGNKVKTIGWNAFLNCSSLKTITLPQSLKTIYSGAFCNCTKLTGVKLPSNLETIDAEAFANCKSIKSIDIPKKVKYIGKQAFLRLPIKSVELKNPEMRVCEKAFYQCENLAKITYPKDIYKIDKNAFEGTPWYKSFYKKSGNEVFIGKCLCAIKKVGKTLTVKDGIKGLALPKILFDEATLPESVKYIQSDSLVYIASVDKYYVDDYGEQHEYVEEVLRTSGIVHCPQNSYAEKYCKKNGCPCDNKI